MFAGLRERVRELLREAPALANVPVYNRRSWPSMDDVLDDAIFGTAEAAGKGLALLVSGDGFTVSRQTEEGRAAMLVAGINVIILEHPETNWAEAGTGLSIDHEIVQRVVVEVLMGANVSDKESPYRYKFRLRDGTHAEPAKEHGLYVSIVRFSARRPLQGVEVAG